MAINFLRRQEWYLDHPWKEGPVGGLKIENYIHLLAFLVKKIVLGSYHMINDPFPEITTHVRKIKQSLL
jgi:hypothetical protein